MTTFASPEPTVIPGSEGRLAAHSTEGFPHYNSRTGACMCLGPCCNGRWGCRCGGCSGEGHQSCAAAVARRSTVERLNDEERRRLARSRAAA